MKSSDKIRTMRATLENNIWEHGWDASVEAASRALSWALGDTFVNFDILPLL